MNKIFLTVFLVFMFIKNTNQPWNFKCIQGASDLHSVTLHKTQRQEESDD